MELDEEHRERVYESVVSDLQGGALGDVESMRRAAHSTKWLEGERRLLEPLFLLLQNPNLEVRASAAECLGHLKLVECLEPLRSAIEKSFEEEQEPDVAGAFRQEAIRAYGKCGQEKAIPHLEIIMHAKVHPGLWSEDERALAVEALTDCALSGSMRALEILAHGLDSEDKFVKELSRCALLEISDSRFWRGKGYHSIMARFEGSKKESGEKNG